MPYSILMLSAQMPPEVFGGAETQCLRQAKILAKRGHNVTILTTRKHLQTPAQEEQDGFTIRRQYTIGQPDLLGRWIAYTCLWIFQAMWFALTHRGTFDCVHCHQGKFGLFIGSMVACILRVPCIVKIGNAGDHLDLIAFRRKKIFGPFFLALALRCRPTFVAISGMIADDLHRFGIPQEQIVRISNAAKPVEASHVKPGTTLQCFWHGRFEPIKNLPLLLDGFALAYRQNPHLHLHLIGDGNEKPALEARIHQHHLSSAVTFHPPTQDIFPLIAQYDIYINTSLAEGMSNAMLEALSLGKCIVSNKVSGSAEIIDEGRGGFLVPEYSAESISLTLLAAAKHYQAHAPSVFNHNSTKSREAFSIDAIVSQYETLYERLIG